jgi:hypothetical protein
MVVSIKITRFKYQPSTPSTNLCIKRGIPFMEIDDKGEESATKIFKGGVCMVLDMDMDQEGARLDNREGSKFLDKRSTQVGGASS